MKRHYEKYTAFKSIMAEGAFNLRKWNSNSKALMNAINDAEKSLHDLKGTHIDTPANLGSKVAAEDESYAKY